MNSAKPFKDVFPLFCQEQYWLIFFVLISGIGAAWADPPKVEPPTLKDCSDIIYTRVDTGTWSEIMTIAKTEVGIVAPCLLDVVTQTALSAKNVPINLDDKTKNGLLNINKQLESGGVLSAMTDKFMDNDAVKIFVVSKGEQIELLLIKRYYLVHDVRRVSSYADTYSLSVETLNDVPMQIKQRWDLKERPNRCYRWGFTVQNDSQDMLFVFNSRRNRIDNPHMVGCIPSDEFLENDGVISVSAESWWSLERHKLRWTDGEHSITVGTSWRNNYQWAFLPVIAGTALTAVSGWTLSLHGQKIEEPGYVQAGIYNTQVPSSVLLSVGLSLQLGGALMLAIKPAAFSRHCPPDNKKCRKSAPKANGGQ